MTETREHSVDVLELKGTKTMSIHFGTGGWRAVIGDEFTRINIQRIATAVAYRMKLEKVQGFAIGYDRRFLSREAAIWFSEALAG